MAEENFTPSWYQRVELVEEHHGRRLLPRLIEELTDHQLAAVDIGAAEIRRRRVEEVEADNLGELTRDERLTAPRRTVQQDAVRNRQLVAAIPRRVDQRQHDVTFQLRAELPHSCEPPPADERWRSVERRRLARPSAE